MSEENSAGASYLASLKKAIAPSGAAAAAARVPEGGAGAEGSLKSASGEKRRSPRYPCQGSAHLRETSTGVATWATFTDISLHGVYVEAMSTYHVGARLALTLEVNNFRVETRGEIRAIYPGLGMGVSFLPMSDENREQLGALVASLSQQSAILSRGLLKNQSMARDPDPTSPDPRVVLQAITDYFEQRHILSRDEFLRILKKSQNDAK
jgi:hypothetical protein